MKVVKEFREFVLRGNVVDLAVGVVIGAAFGSIVTALVRDLITPLLAAIGGAPDFSNQAFTIHGSRFLYGDFINAVISFLIIAAVIFFFVVKPVNHLMDRYYRKPKPEPSTKKCPECLSDIPAGAKRCKYCTAAQKK